jgi:hypothetical protein
MNLTTIELKQRLEVWTPMGKVGSRLVSSGAMVSAIDLLDTRKAKGEMRLKMLILMA